MATSGTTTFDLDIEELITEAYERCGIESRTGYDLRTARRSLNLLFLDWASRGLNLWTIQERSQALTANVFEYNLPTDTVDVLSAVVRSPQSPGQNIDITLNRFSQAEWLHTPNKSGTLGRPAQFYYQHTNQPKAYFFPCPDDSQPYTFVYYAIRRIQDAGGFTNTADVNFKFLPCLVSGLAYYVSMKKAPDRMVLLKQIYEEDFKRISEFDRDSASYYAVPDTRLNY
ncbi:MAG: hypothetical protein EBU08_01185 [Micrococcales bacterium]|jgi:hypothetical protein|nr:hypothetical protein [Micrococcales bacterium]